MREFQLSAPASDQLEIIQEYYELRSPQAWLRIMIDIQETLERIRYSPHTFPVSWIDERVRVAHALRFSQFAVLFTFDETKIIAHAIWDQRQDPDKLIALLDQELGR